jgi:hypothetical protein
MGFGEPHTNPATRWHGGRGSYAAAAQLHQRIVDARDQALGREHPGTLAARNNLAYWTGEDQRRRRYPGNIGHD